MTAYPNVHLKRGKQGLFRPGHPWIYRSQIEVPKATIGSGDLVNLCSEKGKWLGAGYFNAKSEIALRILTRQPVALDKAYFVSKIKKAYQFRERFVRDTNAFRVISSEADEMPGLIVDRYGEILVVQFLTAGMERLRSVILDALREALPSKGIYERSDSGSRKLEGLEDRVGWIERSCGDAIEIHEKNIRYEIRFGEGHKTGFYLDQRENRILFGGLGIKGRVLDAFCYEGGFALHMAAAGAHVTGVDVQEDVLVRAEENRKLNNIPPDRLQFRAANVFDELRRLEKEKERFDFVNLDPPSFVKRKDALQGALAGYKEIILRSMKILEEDGLLSVFSCAYHVSEELLMEVSVSAALDTRKNLKLLHFLKQSTDHPINPLIPETYYLKGFLFQVTSA